MATSLNKAMLIGFVGKDPEVRYIEQGSGNTKVATFVVATSESYKDKDGNRKENTEWHNVVAWRTTADIVEKYVKKGTQMFIEGKIRTRSYNDQSGNKRFVTEVIAENIQLLGGNRDNGSQQSSPQPAPQAQPQQRPQQTRASQAPQTTTEFGVFEPQDDDLPF